MADNSIASSLADNLADSLGSIDRFSIDQLKGRYDISRSILYERMTALKVKTVKVGAKAYVTEDWVHLLDQLNDHIKRGGSTAEFLESRGGQPDGQASRHEVEQTDNSHSITGALVLEAIATPLQAIAESLNPLTLAMTPAPDPFTNYRRLTEVASQGWALPTSELLPLLGLKSTPPLDDHGRFKRKGFSFQRLERAGRQREWRITKLET